MEIAQTWRSESAVLVNQIPKGFICRFVMYGFVLIVIMIGLMLLVEEIFTTS
jgi:hypothetical protein